MNRNTKLRFELNTLLYNKQYYSLFGRKEIVEAIDRRINEVEMEMKISKRSMKRK